MKEIIEKLVEYAKLHLDLDGYDVPYVRNLLLNRLKETEPFEGKVDIDELRNLQVPDILLDELKSKAIEKGLTDVNHQELFACEIMGMLSLRPNEFVSHFNKVKEELGEEKALDYFYNYSIKNNYIQKTAIDKNLVWVDDSKGDRVEISINLSKPEKKNSDIAKARQVVSSSYPKCVLCKENIGFSGRLNKAPRQNIRYVPLVMGGTPWFMQYSPYGYYYQHAIIVNEKHCPMTIGRHTFINLLDFLDQYPSYIIGSNADLPIVGGSILSHEHYQGGKHRFPMFDSKPLFEIEHKEYPSVKMEYLTWYNSVIKLSSKNKDELISLSEKILNAWREYDDEEVNIVSHDENGDHSTITPIANKEKGVYQFFLILRNNRCNEAYPEGIFHAHKEYHNIKSEGIGLIEAMGLFILPGRLLRQMNLVEEVLLNEEFSLEKMYKDSPDMKIHETMINLLIKEHGRNNSKEVAHKIIKEYINKVCRGILDNTAVFKKDELGIKAFNKFILSLGV